MDPSLNSTPQAKGTAPYSEFNMDHHAGSPKNIQRVEADLERSTQLVHILPLLKSFLAEIVLECKGNNTDTDMDPAYLRGIMKESRKIFNDMLSDAISFCNDEENNNRAELMKHLKVYASKSYEKDRYLPLSNALNSILREFADKSYGSIPKPSARQDKENLIFMPNDPHPIESSQLRNDCPQSRRKPDIIGVFVSYLCENNEKLKTKSFDKIASLISSKAIKRNKATPPKWTDVHQPWELKVKDRHIEVIVKKWTNKGLLRDLHKKPENNSLKRSRDTDSQANSNSTTKAKSSRGPFFTSIHTSILPDEPPEEEDPSTDVSTPVQCAYYGIERSSSVWHATYSTVVLVEDTKLSLRRFDAQSCIQSETFDILDHLPILVTMTAISQRFSICTWGLTERDEMKVNVDNKSFRLAPTQTPFQLNGRRTTGTSAMYDEDVTDENANSLCGGGADEVHSTIDEGRWNPDDWDDGMPFFFKSSWVECVRVPEFEIIGEIHNRANKLLPKKYRNMVTDHVPTVIASQVCKNVSTARFRLFLKFAGAFPHLKVDYIQKHARVRIWIVMPRLQAIHDLEPSVFMSVFWDSIRCHYLLWKLGIAHGDISLTNLMYRSVSSGLIGMLNDFDLAAIMKPGTRSPPKTGWERTGTLPFMALDLLKYHSGEIGRWYRHDLESFSWCLLWEMLRLPSRKWTDGTLLEVRQSRHSVMTEIGEQAVHIKAKWKRDFNILSNWFWSWNNYSMTIDLLVSEANLSRDGAITIPEVIAIRNEKDSDTTDAVHIKAAVEAVKKVRGEINSDIPALIDTTWIDVVLEQNDS